MDKSELLVFTLIILILGITWYIYSRDESFQLMCIVSGVDGNKYCVRERDQVQRAADLLAKVTIKMQKLVDYMSKKYPEREETKRLVAGFNPKRVMETLPTSQYTAYSENKGEKLAFCLNKTKKGEDNMIDEHTLTFVAIHELAHVANKTIGHKQDFWENFKFLLQCAKEAGIHEPVDYKKTPQQYCGMNIRDNPYYDL